MSIWTVVYQFWAHLGHNLGAKTGKAGEFFFVKVSIDISFKYFSFLAYKRKVQLLYEMLGTLIEALTTFTVRQS